MYVNANTWTSAINTNYVFTQQATRQKLISEGKTESKLITPSLTLSYKF